MSNLQIKGWRKRKATFFKKGHGVRSLSGMKSEAEDDGEAHAASVKLWDRLPRDVYSIAGTQLPYTPCILRPVSSPVDPGDVSSLDFPTISAGVQPGEEHQPKTHTSDHSSTLQNKTTAVNKTQEVEGKRVLDMTKIANMLNVVYSIHHQQSKNCAGNFILPAEQEKLWGLGTAVGVKCTICEYEGNFKLFEEMENATQKGRKAEKCNVQLGAFMTKSHTPYSDIRFLFATLDIPPPSEHCIAKHVDAISNQWPAINADKMDKNCEIVKTLLKHQKDIKLKPGITCMSDTVYNNPPKGRAMNQPGTQCSSLLVECETTKNMVIGISTLSKLCIQGAKCNLVHPGCTANLAPEMSMGAAEDQLLSSNIHQARSRGLDISSIVEDGVDMKKSKKLGLDKEMCNVHMGRCQRRRVHAIKFSPATVGKTTRGAQLNFKTIIGHAISKRCTKEIELARKKFPSDDSKFLKKISEAKDNILDCLSGSHTKCRKLSSLCTGESDKKILNYTPFKRPLHLAENDRLALQDVINFRLNETMAYRQRNLRNTNRVESLHLRTLKLCPKFKTYQKNYANRNHSAMHSDSVGAGISMLTLLHKIKTAPSTTKYFKNLNKKFEYDSLRQKSEDFRRQRKFLSVQKAKLKRLLCLSVHSSNLDVPIDHTYS